MIDWNKIIDSHNIKTFRSVCDKWWGIDIQFYDEYGNFKSNNIPFQNCFCQLLHSTRSGSKNCYKNYRKQLKGIEKANKAFIYKCNAGIYGVIVPIFVKDKYVGSIIGSGIQLSKNDPRQKTYTKELQKLGFDKPAIEQAYSKLKIVDGDNEEHFLDFMELFKEDVKSFYETFEEKEETIERQAVLLEKVYNKKYKGILGTSPAMKKIFDTLELIENHESSVLIEGESGTGKELLAAAIHYNSPRSDKMFVVQNCSAFSDTLLSSELFGHEKGSFTGAIVEKKGLFEIADGGTLFLDEIGDMDIDIQARLLRVLESGTFYRVGGTEQKQVDVRLIAATNKVLKMQVEKGLFRKDLFYRINTLQIILPPLRERKNDIRLLINHFVETYAESHKEEKKGLNRELIELMVAHDWPGNVRELKNLIERLIIYSGKNKTIEPDILPPEIKDIVSPEIFAGSGNKESKLRDIMETVEKETIGKKLEFSKWNKSITAKELGISRASLNNKIALYNIRPDL